MNNKNKKTKEKFVKDLPAGVAFSKAVVAIPKDENNNAVELIINGIIYFNKSGENVLYALDNLGKIICGQTLEYYL